MSYSLRRPSLNLKGSRNEPTSVQMLWSTYFIQPHASSPCISIRMAKELRDITSYAIVVASNTND